MKKTITRCMSLLLIASLLLAGCSSSSPKTAAHELSGKNILKGETKTLELIPVSLTGGTADKTPYLEFVFTLASDEDKLTVQMEDVSLTNGRRDTGAALDFDKRVRLRDGEDADWTLRASGEEVEDAVELTFAVVCEGADGNERYVVTMTGLDEMDGFDYAVENESAGGGKDIAGNGDTEDSDDSGDTKTAEEKKNLEEKKNTAAKTKWGGDEVGYITLDDRFMKFESADLNEEEKQRVFQWVLDNSEYGDRVIITMMHGSNSVDNTIAGILEDENPDESNYNTMFLGKNGEFDFYMGALQIYFPEDGCFMEAFCFNTDYSKGTYYTAIEGYGIKPDEFDALCQSVMLSHSVLQGTEFVKGFETQGDAGGSPSGNDGKKPQSADSGKTLLLKDVFGNDLTTVTVPEGFTVDEEFTDEFSIVLNYGEEYNYLFINGYVDLQLEEYLNTGKLDTSLYESLYENVKLTEYGRGNLKNGLRYVILELNCTMKIGAEGMPVKNYFCGVFPGKENDVGASLTVHELQDFGYDSPVALLEDLFGK